MKNLKQISFLVSIVALFASAGVFAAAPNSPDDCWKESGNPRIVDGTFIAYLKSDGESAEEMAAKIAVIARNSNLRAPGFPGVSEPTTLYFDLKGSQVIPKESREVFKTRVNAAVRDLEKNVSGLTIECEQTFVHHPAGSGSN